ncbi:MAG TPA: SEC-C metal-binding domain-containing protein [Terriglobales bacterium]|nr:SEC-C metal-binding domain-containing protein [Terriglobales bacterium]
MDFGLVEAAQAQLQRWYPQFDSVVPPQGTAAVRAWRGRIQPFPDGTEFADVMAHLQAGETVRVERDGRLAHPQRCKKTHNFSIGFAGAFTRSFDIILLTFEGSRHPRVYAVSPEISRRAFPFHPHLRDDQRAIIDGKPLIPLCVYLASDGVLQRDAMELVHTLDYTAMFLAKHLVWATTCLLTRFSIDDAPQTLSSDPVLSTLMHRGQVFDGTDAVFAWHYRTDASPKTMQQQIESWFETGYWYALWPASWVGPAAPHDVDELLQQIDYDAECPCGSGQRYSDCHREEHELAVAIPR